jgi:signal peptidase I
MKTGKIDATKLNKAYFFKGKKGTYFDIVLFDKPDDYGNAGFIKQDIPKEARDAGEQGPIIGNWKDTNAAKPKAAQKPAPKPAPDPDLDAIGNDEVPF